MMAYLRELLADGPLNARIMIVCGNAQSSLKVRIMQIDEVGMVCRTYGMIGGLGEPHVRPWACVLSINFD
jgi:hypothetical protein